jgi:hypothetical protein
MSGMKTTTWGVIYDFVSGAAVSRLSRRITVCGQFILPAILFPASWLARFRPEYARSSQQLGPLSQFES